MFCSLNNVVAISSGAIRIYLRPHFTWHSRKSCEGRRRVLTDELVVERPEIVELQSTAAKQP